MQKRGNSRKSQKRALNTSIIFCSVISVVLIISLIAVGCGEKDMINPDDNSSIIESSAPVSSDETSSIQSEESQTSSKTEYGSFYANVKYRSDIAVPADVFKHGRNLILINRQYELPEDFKWDLVSWSSGKAVDAAPLNASSARPKTDCVDAAAYKPLKDMFAAARAEGININLISPFRSIRQQDRLFTSNVNSFLSQGYSEEEAIKKANYSRTFAGTSEHNVGLGFDLSNNWDLSESFDQTEQFTWLMANAENYGFILRYPKDKVDITGIMYEPWHFRYVGIEDAKRINELGMCLEEYIAYLDGTPIN